MPIVARPVMSATIWLRVRLEAKRPMATYEAVIRNVPKYWAITAPTSMSPAVSSAMGIPREAMIPTLTKVKPAMNFAAMTYHVRSGCVSRVSRVPSRCSSDTRRMVAAGTKSVSSIGSHRLMIARIDASGAINSCLKPR